MFRNYQLVLGLSIILILSGCGEVAIGPGTTFDAPTKNAVMLRAPTDAEQVEQNKDSCAPAAAVTLYRVITGKNYNPRQAANEMGTNQGQKGTKWSEILKWLNNHEMTASATTVATTWAVGMMESQIKAGYYALPLVNESAKPNAPHVFIVYGIDKNADGTERILVSDSNKRLGMSRIGIDAKIFQNRWLINTSVNRPIERAFIVFVDSRPRKKPATTQKANVIDTSKTLHGDLLIQ
ncbi:MAG: hypothetical protein HZA94_01420 [Candidatus Vogelbacteria bacterium]|nr:hypothetical protein [Candidatus Vogelbacteria bacterium]